MAAGLVWFTPHASPYRIPAWEALGREIDLTVVLIGGAQANRPTWDSPTVASFDVRVLTPALSSTRSDSPWTGVVDPLAIGRVVRSARPSAVILPGWGDSAGMEVGLLARRWDLPRVGFYGSTIASRRKSQLVRTLRGRYLRSLDSIISYGSLTTNLLIANDGVEACRIVTGFNTVDVERISVAARSARAQTEHTGSAHRFLFCGQLLDRKGAELAIEALGRPELAEATLTVVGAGPAGPGLESLARTLRIDGRVRFMGLVPSARMPSIYAAHHTLVMPSRAEVWGLVANEALAAGLHAIVSTTAGCAPDIARHPGVFVTRPRVESVASAMVLSAASWRGWIESPPILALGPSRLAHDVQRAVEIARRQ